MYQIVSKSEKLAPLRDTNVADGAYKSSRLGSAQTR